MPTPGELVARTADLVSLPDIYLKVKAMIEDPGCTAARLGEVIGKDPSLSARLLRIANSAFFGFSSRIDKVSRAVTLLGMQQLHDLVLATSVTKVFSGIAANVVDMPTFWRNSVICGMLSRSLANRCNVLDSERLFLEGLLRDLGHLIMYQQIPGPAQAARLRAREEGRPISGVERDLLGYDYAEVGGELMRAWDLPASLYETIGCHTRPAAAENYPLEASIVHIAAIMTDAGREGEDSASLNLLLDPSVWGHTGLAFADLDPARAEAFDQAHAVTAVFAGSAG